MSSSGTGSTGNNPPFERVYPKSAKYTGKRTAQGSKFFEQLDEADRGVPEGEALTEKPDEESGIIEVRLAKCIVSMLTFSSRQRNQTNLRLAHQSLIQTRRIHSSPLPPKCELSPADNSLLHQRALKYGWRCSVVLSEAAWPRSVP